jgi:hypothetical protein
MATKYGARRERRKCTDTFAHGRVRLVYFEDALQHPAAAVDKLTVVLVYLRWQLGALIDVGTSESGCMHLAFTNGLNSA